MNNLITAPMIQREVWIAAARYLPGRDLATIQHEVQVTIDEHIFTGRQVLVQWQGERGRMPVPDHALELSLDDFSGKFVAPLIGELAARVFPAPTNEDR